MKNNKVYVNIKKAFKKRGLKSMEMDKYFFYPAFIE